MGKLGGYVTSTLGSASARRVLEIGCANSEWLPYLALKGFEVTGIDYSAVGCEHTRRLLEQANLRADVICRDAFDPDPVLEGAFDAVLSFGVAEHFEDTRGCISALARYVAPGGVLLTLIPNLATLPGFAQRHIDRAIYDIHVPLTLEQLGDAHAQAGLLVERCEPLLFLNTGIFNVEKYRGTALHRAFVASFVTLNAAVRFWERRISRLPANRWTSPYYACVARKIRGAAT